MDTLELQPAKREGGGGKTEREYYDFLINGKSLSELTEVGDTIGALWIGEKNAVEWNRQVVRQLLLKEKSELESGRVPIYICPECGDLGCGALTVKITKEGEDFVWSEFGFEDNYEDGILEQEKIGPFRFNKIDYYNLFSRYITNKK